MDRENEVTENSTGAEIGVSKETKESVIGKAAKTVLRHFVENESAVKNISATALRLVLPLVFTFLCSATSPALGCAPLGIAAVCSSTSLAGGAAALMGTLISSTGEGAFGCIRAAVCAGAFFVRMFIGSIGIVKTGCIRCKPFAFVGEKMQKNGTYSKLNEAFTSGIGANALVSLAAATAIGAFGIITGGNLWYDVFSSFLGIMLIPVFTIAFSAVSSADVSHVMRKAGIGAIAYALILSLADVRIGGMSIAVIGAMVFTMWSAWCLGVSDGVLFGFFCGIALEPSLAAMYAVSGALLAALSGFSLGVGCFGAAVAAASWALYSDGVSAISKVIPEIILATALFYPSASFHILPSKVSFTTERNVKSEKKESDVATRLKKISDAMNHMASVFSGLSKRLCVPDSLEIFSVCEKGFSEYCTDCAKSEICHYREDFKRGSAVKKAAFDLKEKGRVGIDSFSDSMARGCPMLDKIADAINSEYAKVFENASKTDKTSAYAGDYAVMAKLIRETVAEADSESAKNAEMTDKLKLEFEKNKIGCDSIAVYGRKRPRIYVRGFDVRDLTCGASDIREIAENALKTALGEPEMSVDYDRLNMFMESRKLFSVSYGRYSEGANGYEANGDRAISFKGDDGSFYMLVCDGMGSGRYAALTSGVSCVFLEKMIGAGCPVDTALMLLNNFTRERRIECSSSVDLLKIDPFGATASFIKSGAAPSFVLRENKLFRIDSDTPPVGILKKPFAKETKMRLRAGDRIVMMSDGAIPEDDGEAWLYDALTSPSFVGKDLNAGAKRAVEEAMKRRINADDCTVCIVKLNSLSA